MVDYKQCSDSAQTGPGVGKPSLKTLSPLVPPVTGTKAGASGETQGVRTNDNKKS
jgi:hypothetical protein